MTDEYLRIATAWFEANNRHAALVRETDGDEAFERRQAERRLQIKAIEDGLLCRSLFVASRAMRA